ncbi:hypothetical protein CAEBREN_18054 [Caenorhabditis brenneri]|uniref:Uncharacterized protein n=1 Tax=Caenorhabditis brenneri TaxID=135651 RepID=G0MLL5_CAEBE|nr:hypothetical protein CAEBREN_18054 [Caenorhabditis brenneri]
MSTIGKEDVYESDDAADSIQNAQQEADTPSHPDIELVSVDTDEALKKYKNRVLTLTSSDLNEQIRSDENVKTELLNAEVLENLEKEVKTLQGMKTNEKEAVKVEVELPKVRVDSKVATLENRLRRIEQ